MFYLSNTYSRKEYFDETHFPPWIKKLNSVLDIIDNYSKRWHCVIWKIEIILCKLSYYLQKFWIKKNHLVEYGDKESYRILSPIIHDDISKLCSQDLIYYIALLEKYGKKELDTWGFEERPRKKVGKLKRLWCDLTLTVY